MEVVEFELEAPDAVVEQMDLLGEAHSGWLNLHPELPEDEEPPRASGLDMLFSTSVHDVPTCTWVAGKVTRHGVSPDSLGVQHSAGTRTRLRLASLGLGLPGDWRTVQDHPRRGLVVLAPFGTAHSQEIAWLLQAGTLLSTVRLTGRWLAEIHRPR